MNYTAKRVNGNYKTWRCRGRLKGSGCQNRHVEEKILFQEIADVLNADVGTIGAGILPSVERITVENIGVKVLRQGKQASA